MKVNTIAILTPAGELSRTTYTGAGTLLPILQVECGGYVQVVSLTGTLDMWCNEEGKFNGSEWNECATAVWQAIYGPTDEIFGTVVYTGGPDEDGDTTGISDEDYERLERVAEAYKAAKDAGLAGV